MRVRMIVACQQHKHGGPGIFHCVIKGSKKDYEEGNFYDAAKRLAMEDDWQSLMVAIDENDVPSLFDAFPDVTAVGGVNADDRELNTVFPTNHKRK